MKQVGIIERVIETLGLEDGMAKGKFTPAESTPLVKDTDGELLSTKEPLEIFSNREGPDQLNR